MGEISFWGYVVIFIIGVFTKLFFGFFGVVIFAWINLIYTILEETYEGLWNDAELSRHPFLVKFLIWYVLGYIMMFLFVGFGSLFVEIDPDNLFLKFFPLIHVLTN